MQVAFRKSFFLFAAVWTLLLLGSIKSQVSAQNTINGLCVYSYNSKNVYKCELRNGKITNPTDILVIGGTHLSGHTDNDVQEVTFWGLEPTYFNGEILRKFINLKTIIFIQDIKEILQDAFDVCPNLEVLRLDDGEYETLPSQMLKNCQKLKEFTTLGGKLAAIPENLFGENVNLEDIRISFTELTSLPEKLLHGLPNLKSFTASLNKLSDLSPNFFINSTNLENVSFYLNYFVDSKVIINALNGHTELRKLNLDSNSFLDFEFSFFSQFEKLETLTFGPISDNLTNISWHFLPASLNYLSMTGINEELPENMCSQLVNLKTLIVKGKGIKNLHKDTFKSLGHLESLSIEFTSITTLDSEVFTNLTSLSDLSLFNNLLTELPAGVFAPLVNIGSLSSDHRINLNSNNIKRLNANSFGQHPKLRRLYLSSNGLREIERGIFSRFNSTLSRVDLVGNFCIDQIFLNAMNLDNNDRLTWCFSNWAGIETTTSTRSPNTTPGAAGSNFNKFEVFGIIFAGFLGVLFNCLTI